MTSKSSYKRPCRQVKGSCMFSECKKAIKCQEVTVQASKRHFDLYHSLTRDFKPKRGYNPTHTDSTDFKKYFIIHQVLKDNRQVAYNTNQMKLPFILLKHYSLNKN